MKRCWLHVGMHKTGSTSVQVNLSKAGRIPNWHYLMAERRASIGQSLFAMLATDPHEFHTFIKQGKTADQVIREGKWLRAKLAKAICNCREENLILSAEVLSIIDKPGIETLRDFLDPLCDEVRVIGYVRPPIGFKTSHFQQRVKHGLGSFDVGRIRPKYRRRFHKFDTVFGRENVTLRKFDPATFPNRCVVMDFHQQLGIDAPPRDSMVRVNESLSREACGILYAYRKFGPGYGVGPRVMSENKMIIAALLAMGGAKFKVTREVTAAGLLRDMDDVNWMERRLGTSLQEEIHYDGTEITGEEDLLRITRSSCEEFTARFREIHGIRIPTDQLPTDELVDPRQVAALVEYCRSRIRERMRFLPAKGWLHAVPDILKRLLGSGPR